MYQIGVGAINSDSLITNLIAIERQSFVNTVFVDKKYVSIHGVSLLVEVLEDEGGFAGQLWVLEANGAAAYSLHLSVLSKELC